MGSDSLFVFCKECGTQMSKSATKCPQCGAAVKKKSGCLKQILIVFIVYVILQVIVAIGIGVSGNGSSQSTRSSTAQEKLADVQPPAQLAFINVITDHKPIMGSEDFADMLRAVPGCYCLVGHSGDVPLHNPAFVLGEEILPVGASLLARIVERRLAA